MAGNPGLSSSEFNVSSEACFISSKLLKELAIDSDLHLYHSQVPDGQPRGRKATGKSSAELRSLWIKFSVREMARKVIS